MEVKKYKNFIKNDKKILKLGEESKLKKRFYISDMHFGDERLNLYGRDLLFKNSKECDDFIIDKWNKTISKNDQKIKVIFIDNEFFDNKNVNFDELNCPKYITITSKTKPRDYEALFYKYSKAGITGINFDIESVTKGHLALCTKFNLTTCAYGITFERQIEKAKELDLNAIQL